MISKKLQKLTFIITILFIGFLFIQNANAIRISDPLFEKTLIPGETYTNSFNIIFDKQDPDQFFLSVAKMEIEDYTGKKLYKQADPTEPTLANWINIDKDIAQKPKDIKYENGDNLLPINYSISIPQNSPPGSYYAAIIVSEQPEISESLEDLQSKTDIGAQINIQLMITIDGELNYNTEFISFETKNKQFLFAHTPVQFITTFKNQSNIHIIPGGSIEIYQFGNKINTINFNSNDLRTFPGTFRSYNSTWFPENLDNNEFETIDEIMQSEKYFLPQQRNSNIFFIEFFDHVIYEIKNFKFGPYKAKLQGPYKSAQGSYQGQNSTFSAETDFWIIPWHLILTIIFIIIFIIIIKYIYKNFFKKKNS